MITERVKNIITSPTIKIFSEAKKLSAQGRNIIDLSAGEPDFPTPQNVKDAAVKAINFNFTHYTLNPGTLELREAAARKLKDENDLSYSSNEIIISSGAKQGIFNAIQTLIDDKDEVIIPAPYWVSYPEMVKLSGGKAVVIQTLEKNKFKITPEQLSSAVTVKTKAFILCNPSNPTGAVYSRSELEALAEVCRLNKFFIISDEIYEKLVYDNQRFTSFASLEGMKERTILVNGLSKAYAMTGWRIGYSAGPEEIIRNMDKLQGHSTSCASSVSQAAALEALSGPQDYLEKMRLEFQKRRDFLYESLKSINGITGVKPEGAFYLFLNIMAYFGKKTDVIKVTDSFDMAMYLLYESGVAVVPGIAFGTEGYIRLSYAASMEKLGYAVQKIKSALTKLV